MAPPAPATRIVVLGGGYVAIWLVRKLRREIRSGRVELSVIDSHNYHTFHGLVPELLVGKIQAAQLISPSRRLFAPGRYICAEVREILVKEKEVVYVRMLDSQPQRLPYDHLVVNLGTVDDVTRYRGIGEHTIRLKNYFDCLRVRNHLLTMLEMAETETDPAERRRLLHFVIAGGNYAGVEVAAELAEFLDCLTRRDFPLLRREECRVTLVHSGAQILPELGRSFPHLCEHAVKVLRRRGVTLELGVRLKSATPIDAVLSDDRRLDTRTIISCTGTALHPLVAQLPFERDRGGRLVADAFGRVSVEHGIWSAGDCASVPMRNGQPAPPLAIYAMYGGATIGGNLVNTLKGRALKPYSFNGLGDCCVLGSGEAVGQLLGIPVTGYPAWLIWRICMLIYLPSWSKSFRTLLDWMTGPFFGREITSLGSAGHTGVVRELYETGQVIIREGDIGRSMYLIQSGSVEVLSRGPEGERQLAVLAAGSHFGEIAVLQNARRTATIRALEPVALLRISQEETRELTATFRPFAELASSLPRSRPQ